MTNPSWRKITIAKVAAKPDGLWSMVVEHIAGPRLLRFRVLDIDDAGAPAPVEWQIAPGVLCKGNGDLREAADKASLIATAPRGSLIGKLGGSTADLPEAQGAYNGSKVFTVGSYCVVSLSSNDMGALFLTMNDAPESFKDHDLELLVLIEEAPL